MNTFKIRNTNTKYNKNNTKSIIANNDLLLKNFLSEITANKMEIFIIVSFRLF